MGLYESSQKVLVGTFNLYDCLNGSTYRIYSGICSGSIYILNLLRSMNKRLIGINIIILLAVFFALEVVCGYAFFLKNYNFKKSSLIFTVRKISEKMKNRFEVSDKYDQANMNALESTTTAVSDKYNRKNENSSHINLSRKDFKFTKETPPRHLPEGIKRGHRESLFNISSLSPLVPDEHNIEQGSDYLAKKNTPSSNGVNLRIAFCIYGVVARAIEWTWPSIDSQLVEPLEKAGFNITIYVCVSPA